MQTEFTRDTFNQWQISHRLTGWLILKCMLQIHWEPSIEINESEIPVGQCTSIMCNYLLRLMLINDKLNTFIICFYVMMNEHNVHFRSRYKALHTHTGQLAVEMYVQCTVWETIGKNMLKFRACSTTFGAIFAYSTDSTRINWCSHTFGFIESDIISLALALALSRRFSCAVKQITQTREMPTTVFFGYMLQRMQLECTLHIQCRSVYVLCNSVTVSLVRAQKNTNYCGVVWEFSLYTNPNIFS